MQHFATESGKSKGQFYTPAEVSRIMAKVVGIGPDTRPDHTIYDPTSGSGSLLLKAADEAPDGITIYGQEMDNATWALARMNMILHDHPTAELWRGNTLAAPYFKSSDGGLKTFDFAVANPPFSTKGVVQRPRSDQRPVPAVRLRHPAGQERRLRLPPASRHLAQEQGQGRNHPCRTAYCFRGNREAGIRRNLIRRGFIKGIIGLPPNLFYGTGIPACIVVIDKEDAGAHRGIFMIDASRGFLKDGNKNRLRAQDIHRIVDVFNRQLEVPRYSRMVPMTEVAGHSNDYNLNIPRYVDSNEPEDLQDLDAHLHGGIPDRDVDALDAYWIAFPSLRRTAFRGERAARLQRSSRRIAAGKGHHPQLGGVQVLRTAGHDDRRRLARDPWATPPGHRGSARCRERSSTHCPKTCSRASPNCRCSTGTTSTSGSWTTGTK